MAVAVAIAFYTGNFCRFFRLLRDDRLSVLHKLAAYRSALDVRTGALEVIRTAFVRPPVMLVGVGVSYWLDCGPLTSRDGADAGGCSPTDLNVCAYVSRAHGVVHSTCAEGLGERGGLVTGNLPSTPSRYATNLIVLHIFLGEQRDESIVDFR